MKKLLISALAVFAVACGGAPKSQSAKQSKDQEARATLNMMQSRDPSLAGLIGSAAGYIVFPEIGKAGLGVGAALGTGVLYQNGQRVGFVRVEQGSIGAQIGAQSYSELIVLRDQWNVAQVKNNKFSFGANISAVALTAGAGASTRFSNGVAVFVVPRGGAMVEASLSGQRLRFEGG